MAASPDLIFLWLDDAPGPPFPQAAGDAARLPARSRMLECCGQNTPELWNLAGIIVRLGFVVALMLTALHPVWAATTAETARKWGVIGTWAVDCAIPPDRDQPLIIYEVTADRMMMRRDYGNRKDENEVSSADVSEDGILTLRIFFPAFKTTRANGIVMQPDGSIRAVYNINAKGEYIIRDGWFVASGNPTVALHKCASLN
jgi:hypothetical protein